MLATYLTSTKKITPLLPGVILLKLVLLKLQCHKRPHQQVNFSICPAPPSARYYQQPANPTPNLHYQAVAPPPPMWTFLKFRCDDKKLWVDDISWCKCIDNFSHHFSADPFFAFILFVLLVIFTPYLPISVSYFGCCLTTSCRNFDACYNHSCVTSFHAYTGTGLFGGPCILDVSKLFPMKILLITLLDGLKPKTGLPKNPLCPYIAPKNS